MSCLHPVQIPLLAALLSSACFPRPPCDEIDRCDDELRIALVGFVDLPGAALQLELSLDDDSATVACTRGPQGEWRCGAPVFDVPPTDDQVDAYLWRIDTEATGDVTVVVEGNFHPLIDFGPPVFGIVGEIDDQTVVDTDVAPDFGSSIDACSCGETVEIVVNPSA